MDSLLIYFSSVILQGKIKGSATSEHQSLFRPSSHRQGCFLQIPIKWSHNFWVIRTDPREAVFLLTFIYWSVLGVCDGRGVFVCAKVKMEARRQFPGVASLLLPCWTRIIRLASQSYLLSHLTWLLWLNVHTQYRSIQSKNQLEDLHVTSCGGRSVPSSGHLQVLGVSGALQAQSSRKFTSSSLWRLYLLIRWPLVISSTFSLSSPQRRESWVKASNVLIPELIQW